MPSVWPRSPRSARRNRETWQDAAACRREPPAPGPLRCRRDDSGAPATARPRGTQGAAHRDRARPHPPAPHRPAPRFEEVIATAGISNGLLYHYFPTKVDYQVAVVEGAADELLGPRFTRSPSAVIRPSSSTPSTRSSATSRRTARPTSRSQAGLRLRCRAHGVRRSGQDHDHRPVAGEAVAARRSDRPAVRPRLARVRGGDHARVDQEPHVPTATSWCCCSNRPPSRCSSWPIGSPPVPSRRPRARAEGRARTLRPPSRGRGHLGRAPMG